MNIWNQLNINIKSLISWQYCIKDISYINSLTLTMVRRQKIHRFSENQPLSCLSLTQNTMTHVLLTSHIIFFLLSYSCQRCAPRNIAVSSKGWKRHIRSFCVPAKVLKCLRKKTRKISRVTLTELRNTMTHWSFSSLITVSAFHLP